jgi:hypothetical protein
MDPVPVPAPDPEHPPVPARRRLPPRRTLLHHALVLFGLAGLAVTEPVLDLFGRNPEAFVANDLTRFEILVFALVAALAVPVVLLMLELTAYLIGHEVGDGVHGVFVGLLAAVLGLRWFRLLGVDATVVVAAGALALGVGVAVAERSVRSVRKGLRFLALAPVVYLALFVVASDASRLLSDPAAAAGAPPVFTSEERPPIVWLVLDEFPLSTLIDERGQIDAERFPGFARLAERSHWFRNSSSNAFLTQYAVPSMLTGTRARSGQLPIYADHPRNLFTLVADQYEIWQYQVFTDLCPHEVCPESDQVLPQGGGLSRALGDAVVVYGHQVLPRAWRADLPPVDTSWSGFLGDPAPPDPRQARAENQARNDAADDHWQDLGDGRSAANQAAVLGELIDDLDTDASGRLWFAHVALPHAPWEITPLGYTNSVDAPQIEADMWNDWDAERQAFEIRHLRQRHLLQAGALDQRIEALLDRMDELDIWNESLVVITSDHGNSMLLPDPGRSPRADNMPEIFRQPTFVKLPGQTTGEIHDEVASTIDLLPSLVDVLDVEVAWSFDGHSLFDGSPAATTMRVMTQRPAPDHVNPSFPDYLHTVVARHAEDFPRGGWLGVAAVGEYAELVGQPVTSLDLDLGAGTGWHARILQAPELGAIDLDRGLVPITIQGAVRLPEGVEKPPDEILLTLNGAVAGVGGGWSERDGEWFFSGLVAEELFVEGANDVQVLIPTRTAADPRFLLAVRSAPAP